MSRSADCSELSSDAASTMKIMPRKAGFSRKLSACSSRSLPCPGVSIISYLVAFLSSWISESFLERYLFEPSGTSAGSSNFACEGVKDVRVGDAG